MKELTGDVWEYYKKALTVICIPTNGETNSKGCAIMGRGVAAQAKLKIDGIDKELGYKLRNDTKETRCHWLDRALCLSFQVKYGFRQRACPNLIVESVKELDFLARKHNFLSFYLPRPGCGNGGLDYKDVRPLLLDLPNNIFVISFEEL